MRSKRVVCHALVLSVVMMVCSGCIPVEIKWQTKTINKLLDIMVKDTGDGFRAVIVAEGMKKRSLALKIKSDHTKMTDLFLTKRFDLMAELMGEGVGFRTVKTEDFYVMSDIAATRAYWEDLWNEKKNLLTSQQQAQLGSKYTIELEIWATMITIGQYVSPKTEVKYEGGTKVEYESNGRSVETFKFRVILVEMATGKIISNQDGEGKWPRGHSEDCPWI